MACSILLNIACSYFTKFTCAAARTRLHGCGPAVSGSANAKHSKLFLLL